MEGTGGKGGGGYMPQLQRQLRICHVQWWAANALPMLCSTVCCTIPHIVVMLTRHACAVPVAVAERSSLLLAFVFGRHGLANTRADS